MADLYFLFTSLASIGVVLSLLFSFLAVMSNGGLIKCSIESGGLLPKKYAKSTYLLFNNLTSQITLKPGERKEISTGVSIAFHPGIYGMVTTTPYNFLNVGYMVCPQIFDDPSAEIKICVANINGNRDIVIKENEPIALLSFVQGTLKHF